VILAVIIFIIGYILIALEGPINVNKSATALLLAAAIWIFYMHVGEEIFLFTNFTENYSRYQIINPDGNFFDFVSKYEVVRHMGDIAEILFFLMGAMIIVETIDHHDGFSILTNRIKTNNKRKLLWLLVSITFAFSPVLDNLTTAIVMCALLRKLIPQGKERWFFASMIILAANSGGAWSPIGDVTTIMLWMGGQVTASNIILKVFLPSFVAVYVPLIFISLRMKGNFENMQNYATVEAPQQLPLRVKNFVFFLGLGGLIFVPVFKSITHLPPFMGMLVSLAVLWIATEYLNNHKYPGKVMGKRRNADHTRASMVFSQCCSGSNILCMVERYGCDRVKYGHQRECNLSRRCKYL
jgi:Na+/H+ antiporter NhaD/arsenite permease-like protein